MYALPPEPDVWRMWTFEPGVIICLLISTVWYARGVQKIWNAAPRSRVIRPLQVSAAIMAVLTMFVALLSPIDVLGEALFSAHMVQHLLLILVAAPLIVLAEPLQPALWALPRTWRHAVGRWWMRKGSVQMMMRMLTIPAVAWILHIGTLFFWHVPQPYGWALGNEFIHTIEHVTFLVTGVLFWWVALQPTGRRRLGYGMGVLYVSGAGVVMGALGAILTFAPSPWYTGHLLTTAAWHLTPLEDQQLAGVIMWVPSSLVYLGAAVMLMAKWIESESPSLRQRFPVRLLIMVLAVVGSVTFSGCHEDQPPPQRVAGGDAKRGELTFERTGCGSCHVVSGIRTAVGTVGPPLSDFSRRVFIAGEIPNTPEGLVRWIEDPQSIEPGTAMPNLGVSNHDARDIAAYLLTLR